MLSHIIPFNEANVVTDQPWLTPEDHAHANAVNTDFLQKVHGDMEGWMVEHLEEMASQGDQQAIGQLTPFCHYILTTDFRIVQEPNFMRWGIFLERGMHRIIDKTNICAGQDRERCDFSSWAAQQRHKRKRMDAPSFKIEETYVSTVFIGTCDDELFETMIFGGWLNTIRWKTSTLEAAKKAHWSAVTLAHLLKRYIKRHGRSVRKDWVRLSRFWHLARKRGPQWAMKHIVTMQKVEDRLGRVPGGPVMPQPDLLMELAQQVVSRRGVPDVV
jgi:hypothetical protein